MRRRTPVAWLHRHVMPTPTGSRSHDRSNPRRSTDGPTGSRRSRRRGRGGAAPAMSGQLLRRAGCHCRICPTFLDLLFASSMTAELGRHQPAIPGGRGLHVGRGGGWSFRSKVLFLGALDCSAAAGAAAGGSLGSQRSEQRSGRRRLSFARLDPAHLGHVDIDQDEGQVDLVGEFQIVPRGPTTWPNRLEPRCTINNCIGHLEEGLVVVDRRSRRNTAGSPTASILGI